VELPLIAGETSPSLRWGKPEAALWKPMVDLERLRDNLKYIRRGRGLTFAKLAECQYVMEVLGDLPLRVAYERLAGMVRMLGEDVQAMALRNAYAIDMLAPDTHSAP
jgi:hypothetical protein